MAKQSFVTGQVLTAQQVNDLQTNDFNQTVSAKTASYTLVAADKGTRITMSSTSATTITVNTGLFAAGDTLFIQNLNTGVSTITAGTATVDSSASLALAQHEGGTLYFTSAGVSTFFKAAGAASAGSTYAVFRDEKSSGTGGGTATSGAFRTRDINATQSNNITGASISSNQITLPAGTYFIFAFAGAFGINQHQCRFQNITDSTTAILGLDAYNTTSPLGGNHTFLQGVVTIASSKVFELQHQVTTTRADTGFGTPTGYGTEIYATVSIQKF